MKIRTLIKLELLNFLGINELRHVKDPSVKKNKGLIFGVLIFLYIVLIGYVVGQSVMLGKLGASVYIPILYMVIAFMVNLAVGIYRAKAAIYRESDLEMISAYPVSGESIVASRVFRLYFDNLIVGIAILVPSMIVYGINAGCSAAFYISILPVCIILPILPTAIASWIGIVFAAIIARNRHKVLTEVILVIVFMVGSFVFGGIVSSKTGLGSTGISMTKVQINEEIRAELTRVISEKMSGIESAVPAFRFMKDTLNNADFGRLAVYALISLAVIILTIIIIGRKFFDISRKLFDTKEHREYKPDELKEGSVMTALIKKEAARYFSSGIYVSNTIVGPVMAIILAVALGFMDIDKIIRSAGEIPFDFHSNNLIPFLIGFILSMMAVSTSSVSIEGKNWWIMQTLPLSIKDILKAKVLFNLIFITPFYTLVEIILLFTVNAGPIERIWLILIPGILIVFSVLLGLMLNLKFPKFNWENETEVVKQSAATGFSLFGSLPVIFIGFGAAFIPGALSHLFNLIFILIMGIICLFLYSRINRVDINKLH